MPSSRFPIPQGTLDMMILQILSLEPAHGYGIAQRLEQISRSIVQVNQGSLYPALHRLEQMEVLQAGREACLIPCGGWDGTGRHCSRGDILKPRSSSFAFVGTCGLGSASGTWRR